MKTASIETNTGEHNSLVNNFKKLTFMALFIFMIFLCAISASAKWEVNYDELSSSIKTIAYGKGIYVAAGDNGIIKTSTDARNWTIRMHQSEKISESIDNLMYINNQFIAITVHSFYTSGDGIKWTRVGDNKVGASLLAFNGKLYTTVGIGKFYYSKDLKNWTAAKNTSFDIGYWNGLTWGGDRFVAVGLCKIRTSKDGITWTESEYSKKNDAGFPGKVVWTGKYYYTYYIQFSKDYSQNQAYIYSSADGSKWNQAAKLNIGRRTDITAMKYYNNTLYLCTGNEIYYSGDLKKWSKHDLSSVYISPVEIKDFALNGKKIVAVGNDSKNILLSENGSSWENFSWGIEYSFYDAATNDKNIVFLENSGKIIVRSGDSYKEVYDNGDTRLNRIIYANNKYVAVGENKLILVSDDGLEWAEAKLIKNEKASIFNISDVTWDGENFVALADGLNILKSKDALEWEGAAFSNWMEIHIDLSVNHQLDITKLVRIAYKDGYYYFAGTYYDNMMILRSRDLKTLEIMSADLGKKYKFVSVSDMKVINGEVLILTEAGLIFSSKDGKTWRLKSSLPPLKIAPDWCVMAYNGMDYVSTSGELGTIYTSKDGIKWTNISLPVNTGGRIYDIITFGDKFVLVGDKGAFITWSR